MQSCLKLAKGAMAALLLALTPLGAVHAQEALPDFYKEPGVYPNRDYVNQHATENVDPFTGSLQIHSTDIYLPGKGGFDLRVIRSFNSSRINPLNPADLNTTSLTGLGWTVHFGRVLKKGPNTSICVNNDSGTSIGDNPVLELPDGSRQVLAFTGSTSPLMLTTQRWKAECLSGTGLSVYSPEGIRYDMTQQVLEVGGPNSLSAWYTTKITDRNGNSATVSYAAAASPQISGVTTTDGRSITFNYLDSGNLARRISTIVTGGRTWTYSYQNIPNVVGRHFLTSVSRPDSPSTSWQYAYNTTASTSSADYNQLRQMTTPQGGSTTYGYGYVFFDTASNPNSRSVVVASKTASGGGNWSFTYTPAASGNQYDTTVVTTPSGNITYRHFGANFAASGSVWRIGLLYQKQMGTLQTETNTWGAQQISTENNLRQGAFSSKIDTEVYAPILTQRLIVRDGVTYQTTFSNHDAYGNPQTAVEAGPNGGSRTSQLTYFINTAKWVISQLDDEVTTGVGSVVRTWDVNGNMLSETRDGVATSYTRHTEGDVWTITRPRGLVSTYTNYVRGIPQNESHPEGVNISRVVSDAGNVTSETNGEGRTTSYLYDGLNRVTRITPPAGNPTNISYTATSKTATRGSLQQVTTFDQFGRATNVNTAGISVATSYDSLGRKTFGSVVGYPSVGHSFLYDLLDRVTRITHTGDASYRGFTYSSSGGAPTLAVRDERNFITTHTYRAYGNPDAPLVMNIAAPVSAASVSIARNGRGLVTSASQGGVTRQFNYDARNYLVSAVHPETGTTVYGRDAAGNMTSKQVGSSGVTTFDYDGRNRLSRVTYPGNSPSQVTNTYRRTDRLRTVSNAIATRTYGYDNNENLTSESLVVDGLTLAATYNYNANDQLSTIGYPVLNRTVSFNPNVLGRPTTVSASTGTLIGTTFWPNGQIYDIAFTGGSRVTYGQNVREWLNSVTVRTGDNVVRIDSSLAHDVSGNLYQITDSVDAAYNRAASFDGINRLVGTTGPWGAGSVSYSGSGNVLTQVLGAESRFNTYDSQNRLSSFTRDLGPSGGSTAYSVAYDAYGNVRSSFSDDYTFDNASNLTSRSSGEQYRYDGANTRVKTEAGGAVTYEFRSAHGLLLAEWTKQSGYYDTLKEHIFLAGKEVAEQRTFFLGSDIQPTSLQFLQPDANGSPISATWSGGGILFKENYQPYGSQINALATAYTDRAFAGHTQEKPDLIYMGGRYYDPLTARFLSIDPKEADPSDLHSLNRYAYANNNPYRYVDPDGYSPVDLAFLAVDAYRLGSALFTGGNVGEAAFDVGLSIVGVMSPVPGVGQGLKALKVADKVVEGVRGADRAVEAAVAAKGSGPVFQRVVSNAELKATQETGLLRGGRTGENFFTDAASLDAKRAQQRLGLDGPLRDQRIEFRITNDAAVSGPRTAPGGRSGTSGGGREFSTNEPTQIEILQIKPLRR